MLHLRTGNIVEARDIKLREDVTVERTYINALLKGRQHYYPKIPFIPLPVEYVAEQPVREHADLTVQETVNETANEAANAASASSVPTAVAKQAQGSDAAGSVGAESNQSSERPDSVEEKDNQDSERPVPADAEGMAVSEKASDDDAAGNAATTRAQFEMGSDSSSEPTPAGSQPRRSSKRQRRLRRSKRKREANRSLRDYIMATVAALDTLTGHPGTPDIALESPQRDKWWTAMELEIEAHRHGDWLKDQKDDAIF
ncbi:hypothetical protein PR003_g20481 [Phytophthora rubi]|nr:hypothetical protein PR003_g20481 [Phytophthora rubi]